jgi:hypothetical protein
MSEDQLREAKQVKLLIHKARQYLERGEPREAMRIFRQVLAIEPEHPHVRQWVAKLETRMKRPVSVSAAGAAGQGSAAARPPAEHTILATVQTDVHPASFGAESKKPPRPPQQARRAQPPGKPAPGAAAELEMDTTAPGARAAALERTNPLTPAAPAPSAPRRAVAVSRREAPQELDTSDPDVAALLEGSAQGSRWQRLRPAITLLAALVLTVGCVRIFHAQWSRYRIVLEADSPELPVEQGRFFFSGWSDPKKVAVGYDAGWQQRLGQPKVLDALREGIVFESGAEVDAFIVSLYTRLGERALAQEDPGTLREAVYYFKQARRVHERMEPPPANEAAVRSLLVQTLMRLSDQHAARGETLMARDALGQARQYEPGNAEVEERQAILDRPPPTPEPTAVPTPTPKKAPSRGRRSPR